jgi:hypothetical protein
MRNAKTGLPTGKPQIGALAGRASGAADARRDGLSWRQLTGSDFLMDGGVTASYRFGDPRPEVTMTKTSSPWEPEMESAAAWA